MLKIEDLKVGDELEFINEDAKAGFIKLFNYNINVISNCFSKGRSKILLIEKGYVLLDHLDGDALNVVVSEELTYFHKVEDPESVVNTTEKETDFVNADLGSKKEVYSRLLEGEVFYFKDEKYVFEGNCFYTYYSDGGCDTYINSLDDFEQFRVKTPWYKFVSKENPVLCKVWDCDSDGYKYYSEYNLVIGFDMDEQRCYLGEGYRSWMGATPVKPSECYQGE